RLGWSGRFASSMFSWCLKVLMKSLRAMRRIRAAMFGPSFEPNLLDTSWIYIRQLSKDVRETLAELDPELVICDDPNVSVVAAISSNHGVKRFGFMVSTDDGYGSLGGARLVDLETGLPLPDGSVGGLFVDATLRRCTDLRVMLHEFTRVLKDGGRVAIKADRLAMSANGVGSRVYV